MDKSGDEQTPVKGSKARGVSNSDTKGFHLKISEREQRGAQTEVKSNKVEHGDKPNKNLRAIMRTNQNPDQRFSFNYQAV
jgi:hypothetical protein